MLLLLLHFLQHGLLELDQVAPLSLAEAQPKSPDTFTPLFARITPESVFPFDEAAGVVAVALVAGAEVDLFVGLACWVRYGQRWRFG